VTDPSGVLDTREWAPVQTFDDFALGCCRELHLDLLSDPNRFSLLRRAGGVGPLTLSEYMVGSDLWMHGEQCSTYRVLVPQTGHMDSMHRGQVVSAEPGTAAVCPPGGAGSALWAAGSKIISFKIDCAAVEDALSDTLGRQVMSHVAFTPVMPITAAATRYWINMLSCFKEQLFQPNSLVNQPLVGLPFADSLIRGLLLAADNPYRSAIAGETHSASPPAIRAAVQIIEEEAHLPLTVSSIAKRCHVSVRGLQQGFRRHMGVSPMAYLREVRLRRAHHCLLESDPSVTSVASVAHRWGFTNVGRFAAAHTARYDEPPAASLRRRTFRRSPGQAQA
jgi:AraC-like DNA-binding protein